MDVFTFLQLQLVIAVHCSALQHSRFTYLTDSVGSCMSRDQIGNSFKFLSRYRVALLRAKDADAVKGQGEGQSLSTFSDLQTSW